MDQGAVSAADKENRGRAVKFVNEVSQVSQVSQVSRVSQNAFSSASLRNASCSTRCSTSSSSTSIAEEHVDAEEAQRPSRSARMESGATVQAGADGESRSKPGGVEISAVVRQDIVRSKGRMSSLDGSGSFRSSAGNSLCASELAKMLSGSRSRASSSSSFSSLFSVADGEVEVLAEDG